ncbi:unnamed protein product [Hymenolepis diminuta]|uniref:Ras-associating domain-containing protein n=1 Tax=Hymenolepis diminuta TaxID=6216 RepID=A0A0R3SER5_HYMDI|nr:unnamed protein product [Hymenolepis diminuta]
MYNTSSLRSRSNKRRRLFSLKRRGNSLSISAIDDFPYSVSKWGSQASLYSTRPVLCFKEVPLEYGIALTLKLTLNTKKKMGNEEQRDETGKGMLNVAGSIIKLKRFTIMKVHNADRTYKSILLNDDMRVGQICEIMLDKNHRRDSIVHWQIFEEPGDFPGFGKLFEF